jgi:tetratricopeptide (TPR) repeat protein
MKKWIEYSLLMVALAVVLLVTGLLALPQVVLAVPAQYRYRLPEPILDLVTTPLPDILPTPAAVSGDNRVGTLPALMPLAPTSTVTAPPPPIIPTAQITQVATPTAEPTATATATVTPTPSPTPLPAAGRVDGLKIVAQGFNNCGPATLTVNLNFHGHPARQADVASILKPTYDDRNVTPEEMRNYVLEQTGLQAAVYRGGDLALLKRFINVGLPVIIEKGYLPDPKLGWMGHYLTVFAYDDAQAHFLAIDTYLGPWDSSGHRYSYENIETTWNQFNNTFILLYQPEQEAMVHELLGPEMVDPAIMWQNSIRRAHEMTQQQPDNAFAWFNLGSSLTRLGEILANDQAYLEVAANAFDQARAIGLPPRMLWYQFEPYVAYLAVNRPEEVINLTNTILGNEGGRTVEETYYYQGQALLALDNEQAARTAFRRALQLNGNYHRARAALDALD